MNFIQKSLYDDKAANMGILALGAIAVVAGAATLYVGMLVNSQIQSNISRSGFSAAENTTYTGINTNVNTAFTLIGVGLIVTGAAIILSVIRTGF